MKSKEIYENINKLRSVISVLWASGLMWEASLLMEVKAMLNGFLNKALKDEQCAQGEHKGVYLPSSHTVVCENCGQDLTPNIAQGSWEL